MINIFQPSLGNKELEEIKKVFRSNWIGRGRYVAKFEKLFAYSLISNPANFTSTTCCTEAIFLASKLFNFNSNDEIIVPSISFIAVGNSILESGAKLVLCDVDKYSLNVTADILSKSITKKTKAIFINHYGGIPCEMDSIGEICKNKNIILIEDSACAPKSFYKGKACGTFSDMGMWSFDAMKILCTGDGGMIYLKDSELVEAAKEFLYLGTPVKQKSGLDSSTNANSNWWEFEINTPGRRAIMNDIAGAIGCVQLSKLNDFIKRRKAIHEVYMAELSGFEWLRLPPHINNNCKSSYYFFWIQLEKRNELAVYLLDNNIYSTFRYWPLNKIKYFNQIDFKISNSDWASEHTLNIPIHQALSDNEVSKVIDKIKMFGKKYC